MLEKKGESHKPVFTKILFALCKLMPILFALFSSFSRKRELFLVLPGGGSDDAEL